MKPIRQIRSLVPGNKRHNEMVEHEQQKEKYDMKQQTSDDEHNARFEELQAMKRIEHDQREKSIPRFSRMLPKGPPVSKPASVDDEKDESSLSLNSSLASMEESFRGLERATQKSFRRSAQDVQDTEELEADDKVGSDVTRKVDLDSLQASGAPPAFRRKPLVAQKSGPGDSPKGPSRSMSAMPSLGEKSGSFQN